MTWIPRGTEVLHDYHGFYSTGDRDTGERDGWAAAYAIVPEGHPMLMAPYGEHFVPTLFLQREDRPLPPCRGAGAPFLQTDGLPGLAGPTGSVGFFSWYNYTRPPAVWGYQWANHAPGMAEWRYVLYRLVRAAWLLGTPGQAPHDRYLAAILRSKLRTLGKVLRSGVCNRGPERFSDVD